MRVWDVCGTEGGFGVLFPNVARLVQDVVCSCAGLVLETQCVRTTDHTEGTSRVQSIRSKLVRHLFPF